jgi:hypothetical protein
MQSTIANTLWLASTLSETWRFYRATRNTENTQHQLLLSMIRANEKTAFGREYSFEQIHSVADYQRLVPLRDYDDYAPYIERIAAGEQHILTAEPVTLFEPTSGSTAATKLIPYTASLKQQFNLGIAPWISNLFSRQPALIAGQAYWSISPIDETNSHTPGGIPIGFEDDTDYLGRAGALLRSIMAVPSLVKLIQDIDAFRYVTLLFLLRNANLRLISVWNPTFLTILLDALPVYGEQLVTDMQWGTLNPPAHIAPHITQAILQQLKPMPERAKLIREALALSAPERHRKLWSKLRLVSCWVDGAAAYPAQRLAALLPQARLQGKGLIATEAFVSFPMWGKAGSTLAITSHFLEFISEADDVHLAHELVQGEQYRVVVTTGGGLYRYQLHDLVEALGGLKIRFIGRSANIADMFGEKVSEGHVRVLFEKLFIEMPAFAILSPETYSDGSTAYTLFTSSRVSAELLEQHLSDNYHYAYCRRLNQLAPARVMLVGDEANDAYLRACVARGQRAGDVKVTVLYRHGGLLEFMVNAKNAY